MIVIASQRAQDSASFSDLDNPPALTVNCKYGSYVCKGARYTAESCLDLKIPTLEENEVALVKDLDLNTIGCLMRASDSFIDNPEFWSYAQGQEEVQDESLWERYNGALAWLEENAPTFDEDSPVTEVTSFFTSAKLFIQEALEDGHLATRMGRAYLYLRQKLDERTFYKEYPHGLLCRKTEGEFANDLYRNSRVVCSYDNLNRAITISSKKPIAGFSCRDFCNTMWGSESWGDEVSSGSPKHRALGEGEFIKVTMKLMETLSRV
jgi:hypothetical protein